MNKHEQAISEIILQLNARAANCKIQLRDYFGGTFDNDQLISILLNIKDAYHELIMDMADVKIIIKNLPSKYRNKLYAATVNYDNELTDLIIDMVKSKGRKQWDDENAQRLLNEVAGIHNQIAEYVAKVTGKLLPNVGTISPTFLWARDSEGLHRLRPVAGAA